MRKGAGSIRFWGQGFTHAIELLLAVAQSSQAGRIEEDGHTRLTSLTPAPIRGLQVISYAYPPGGPSLGEALRGDTASITSRQRPVPMPFPALPVKQDRAIQLTRQLGVYSPGWYPAADCGASHALALLLATHGFNNPVNTIDPTGHRTTECGQNGSECGDTGPSETYGVDDGNNNVMIGNGKDTTGSNNESTNDIKFNSEDGPNVGEFIGGGLLIVAGVITIGMGILVIDTSLTVIATEVIAAPETGGITGIAALIHGPLGLSWGLIILGVGGYGCYRGGKYMWESGVMQSTYERVTKPTK
jgi:hypothetical protein